MTHASPRPRTAWMDVVPLELPPLDRDCTADICIIGAGISGIATAYQLVREGRSVVVVDDGPVGAGMTQRTTAHLSNAVDDRYLEIERHHSLAGARIAAESHTAAIDEIERTVGAEGIDCDFERVDGYLFSPPGAPPNMGLLIALTYRIIQISIAMIGLAYWLAGRSEVRELMHEAEEMPANGDVASSEEPAATVRA